MFKKFSTNFEKFILYFCALLPYIFTFFPTCQKHYFNLFLSLYPIYRKKIFDFLFFLLYINYIFLIFILKLPSFPTSSTASGPPSPQRRRLWGDGKFLSSPHTGKLWGEGSFPVIPAHRKALGERKRMKAKAFILFKF